MKGDDFGKGYGMKGDDFRKGHGMMKGDDFGKGYGMKGEDFGKGHGGGDFGKKGGKAGKGCKKGAGKAEEGPTTEKIWVGDLPRDMTEEKLHAFFSSFGTIQSIDFKVDRETGMSRGFAFVVFESIEAAEAVLKNRKDNVIDGKWVWCKPAVAGEKGDKGGKGKHKDKDRFAFADENVPVSEKLFINNLPPETTEDAVVFHFCQFGNVQSASLKKDSQTGAFRGFAFVTFESAEEAQLVLDSPEASEFEGISTSSRLDIKPAVAKGDGKGKDFGKDFGGKSKDFGGKGKDFGGKGKGKDFGGKGKDAPMTKIWVGCIPLIATDRDVRQYFENFGPVTDVVLDFDEGGLSMGVAHVNFQSADASLTVLGHYGDRFDPLEWEPGILLDIKPAGKVEAPVTEKIFVGSLARTVRQEEIEEAYSKFGPLKEVAMKNDPDGSFRGFAYVTFRDVASARKALDARDTLGFCKAYFDRAPEKGKGKSKEGHSSEPLPEGTNALKVSGLPREQKQRDVFRHFFNYSVTRIRDTGDDIFIEFTSEAECKKAFKEKSGQKLGAHFCNLAGATQEELAQALEIMKATQENKGGKGRDGPY